MKLLKITDRGLNISLDGVNMISCPAEIDITKFTIEHVLIALRKFGVVNFIIENTNSKKSKRIILNDKPKVLEVTEIKEESNKIDIDLLLKKLERIETLLSNQCREDLTETIILRKEDTIKKKKVEEKTDSFIPSVDISGFEVRGNTTFNEQTINENINSIAEQLKDLED